MEEEFKSLNELIANRQHSKVTMTDDEFTELQIKKYNDKHIPSEILDCPKCRNKGMIAYMSEYKTMALKKCDCFKQRENFSKMYSLGLLESIKKIPTIQDIPETTMLGKYIKIRLNEYLSQEPMTWLAIFGQSGCGKTTYASLVISNLIEKNPDLTFMVMNWDSEWEDLTYQNEDCERLMWELKRCDVLYLDDFFRHQELKLTDLERRAAKEIIDYRYRYNKLTIITSERSYAQLREMDEAIVSRIYEKATKKYVIDIKKNDNYNFREQKEEEITTI